MSAAWVVPFPRILPLPNCPPSLFFILFCPLASHAHTPARGVRSGGRREGPPASSQLQPANTPEYRKPMWLDL